MIAHLRAAAVALACLLASFAPARGLAGEPAGSAIVVEAPAGYRDWRLVSVAHEEGDLNDLRAILGNDIAIEAYRTATLPFPDGAIITRLAWAYESSAENDATFGRSQSFVAGAPKNGVQFMIKDSKRFAASGGWGFAQFEDGKPIEPVKLSPCIPRHQAVKQRDLIFTRYSR